MQRKECRKKIWSDFVVGIPSYSDLKVSDQFYVSLISTVAVAAESGGLISIYQKF